MTEKQVDAAINVPVNYCDMLVLVVPYKSLTMIMASFPCLNVIEDSVYGISVKYSIISTGFQDPRFGPKITSTPIKCHVMLLKQIFTAF